MRGGRRDEKSASGLRSSAAPLERRRRRRPRLAKRVVYSLVQLADGLLEDGEVGTLGRVLGPAPAHQVHDFVLA